MNTQLEQNTQILKYFLKDHVNDSDVADYMSEIKQSGLEMKLRTSEVLTNDEINQLIELLKGINNLFRTYGKKSSGLENYIRALKDKSKSNQ